MIIDHGYRPADLGDRDPNTFAISLLIQAQAIPDLTQKKELGGITQRVLGVPFFFKVR